MCFRAGVAIYAPMICDLYGPVCFVFDVCRSIIRGQGRGGWALEIDTFLCSVKWHRAVRGEPFGAVW
jgi:hypothetical protein